MDIGSRLFAIFQSILYLVIIISACIYSIPIICIHRFRQNNNIFTLNVCLATILSCFSWLPFHGAFMFDNPVDFIIKSWPFLNVAQILFTIQLPLSFVTVSVHRYCSVVYHTKILFKTKRWLVLCIRSQWMLGFILSIPNLVWTYMPPGLSIWPPVHNFTSVVVVPSIICLIANMLIYGYVRSSSRRVQPQVISGDVQQTRISHRDICLLRHMVLMFCIFVGGWVPIYLIFIISYYTSFNEMLGSISVIWCEISMVIDTIDLFLYNHKVRKYLKDLCLRSCVNQ